MKRIYLLLMLLAVGAGMLRAESKVVLLIGKYYNSELTILVDGEVLEKYDAPVDKVKTDLFEHPWTQYKSSFQEIEFLSDGPRTIDIEYISIKPTDLERREWKVNGITLDLKDGETYYINLKTGMKASTLKEISEKEANKKMNKWEQLKTVVVK